MTYPNHIPADVEAKIKELIPEARLARRQHEPTDPKVLASKELTEIFCKLRQDKCPISVIARAADMTYHSVSARIKQGEQESD